MAQLVCVFAPCTGCNSTIPSVQPLPPVTDHCYWLVQRLAHEPGCAWVASRGLLLETFHCAPLAALALDVLETGAAESFNRAAWDEAAERFAAHVLEAARAFLDRQAL